MTIGKLIEYQCEGCGVMIYVSAAEAPKICPYCENRKLKRQPPLLVRCPHCDGPFELWEGPKEDAP